jgi:molecular chaperone GrpE
MSKKEKQDNNENMVDPEILKDMAPKDDYTLPEGDGVSLDFTAIELEKLKGEVKKSQDEAKDLKDQCLRLLAENENIRRRSEREVSESRKFAVTSIVKDLVNVAESLYRSTEHISQEDKKNDKVNKIVEGIELTRNELVAILTRNNVKRVEPQIGDVFDHNLHQALSQVQDKNHPKNSIIQVIQAGYLIEGRLIKPALVVVSAG